MTAISSWLLRVGEHANPMLVRRVRQELRNRASLGTILLVLLVAVIAAAIAAAADSDHAGRGLFAAVASAWSAMLCLQANAASRAIAGDRGAAAWDLIELTGMAPLRIVAGVVQSSLVLGLLGAAALAPFLVMAYLLRGLDLPSVIFAILTLPMAGALLGAFAAMTACIGGNRQARQGVGLILALGLLMGWIGLTSVWVASEDGLARWMADLLDGDDGAVIGLLAMLNSWAAALALTLVLGATLLTHRALDRSSLPRLAWCLIWLNGLLWLGGLIAWVWIDKGWARVSGDLDEVLAVCATIGVTWALLLGLFAVSEDIELTARQQESVRVGGRWRRAAMHLLGPGAARGARCTLALLAGSLALCAPWMPDTPALVIAAYGVFVLALGDALARGPLARFCHAAAPRRVCTVALLLVLGLAPALAALFADGPAERLLLALSPFAGPVDLFSRGRDPSGSMGGWVVFAMGLLGLGWLLLRAASAGRATARITAADDDANPRS